MKIIKKSNIPLEPAHGGAGMRRLYLSAGEISNPDFQAFTRGFLPAGNKFSFHHHDGVDEMVLILKGSGIIRDHDGEYPLAEGDFFIFPSGIDHEMENTSRQSIEYVCVRIKSKR